MGFLSAIFKVFFPSGSRSTKPEKSERDYDLSEIADARECGPCKFEITFDDEPEDEALYKLGKKKDAPWKGKYLPNVPGLSFMREDV